jgi:FKBP-type peptidyl-prolyl cis-trans isomerase SlyD
MIENGKVVSIEYTLKDVQSNEVLDTNVGADLLEFVTGSGALIPGLESEIQNHSKEDEFEVVVPASEAYGEVDETAVQNVPKEQFTDIDLSVGMSLYGEGEDGQVVQVTVQSFDEENVVIDYNHPLAGKDLKFEVVIKDVRDATDKEVSTGEVGAEHCGNCGCED